MTREEAIAKLKNFADHCDPNEEFLMAIEALSVEPCEDAISRKSVIDVLTRNRVHFCDMVRITSELKELPSVTSKQKMGRWIPASEPPKKEGKYLVCIEYKHKGVVVERYQMTADFYRFSHIDMSWCPDNENAAGDIVAWRELPEPYKAEKGEE